MAVPRANSAVKRERHLFFEQAVSFDTVSIFVTRAGYVSREFASHATK